MKNTKSNLHYFKISQENPEPHLDKNYFFLEKHPELPLYLAKVKDIKEILITIKKLREEKENNTILEKYYQKLFNVFNSNYSNCSELGCFVNACDTTRDLAQNDYNSFKAITNLFIKKRELDDKVPANWIQAIIDSNSSRRKGELGEEKLISILRCYDFSEVNNWEQFNVSKKCVARFSKDIFSTISARENLGIKIETKKQDKRLDLLIKCGNKIFLLEAKHLNVGGGEQDKQISELIEILSLKEDKNNVYYISFLDGTYSNALFGVISNRAKKKLKQIKEINYYLTKYPNNYWVNTAGFKILFFNLK